MNIPGLGEVSKDEQLGWYYSEPKYLALLKGELGRVVIDGYDEDEAPQQYHVAIANLLSSSFAVLQAAEQYVFQYYQDMNAHWDSSDEEFLDIGSPPEVWRHVQLGSELVVSRRHYGDRGIYVSIECNCDWEPEHGLQIVLRDGKVVTKVGPYDGHLTNSDAFADDALENVVYR
ncbi:DUF6985 domain-containing protein [Aquabacterium sp. A7-Y]|uniref:DUF6985 domain-containing protein n=1 Tax=Aquabacterium sp. A7-Y TaxID=1349605 RepID=UPI0039FD056D